MSDKPTSNQITLPGVNELLSGCPGEQLLRVATPPLAQKKARLITQTKNIYRNMIPRGIRHACTLAISDDISKIRLTIVWYVVGTVATHQYGLNTCTEIAPLESAPTACANGTQFSPGRSQPISIFQRSIKYFRSPVRACHKRAYGPAMLFCVLQSQSARKAACHLSSEQYACLTYEIGGVCVGHFQCHHL